jgi:hypothetical protein
MIFQKKRQEEPNLIEKYKILLTKCELMQAEIDSIKIKFEGIKKRLDRKLALNRVEEEEETDPRDKVLLPERYK